MNSEKICLVCGRRMQWRKAWADCWEEIKMCSAACRKRGLRKDDLLLEEKLEDLLRQRGAGKSICPSELAREHFGEEDWRSQMETVRMAARRLVAAGKAEILQKGRPVDPSTARGPIRIRGKR